MVYFSSFTHHNGRQCGWLFLLLLMVSCARMGNPDGGWFDDTPPYVVSSSPDDFGLNTKAKKVVINFNEFIKVEDVQNKVIVSPPQLEQPEIKAAGRRIIVELKDSLQDNTTYTIDFSDAITDNNEGNPMGNYTFSFSTGDHIDTLQVSGYCLNAEDLEPIKGMLVGLYPSNAPDSLFRTKPFVRVSRTNGSGQFTIKGVAPGSYVVYALQDADGDYLYSQKSEVISFSRDSIMPTSRPDTRQDTIWADTLHIAAIKQTGYTHFLPDDVTLLCFQELQTDRYLLKNERQMPERLSFYFSYGDDSLPRIKGLNFNSDSAFVVEPSLKNDTVVYWLRDTMLVNTDTLCLELTFNMTDSLGCLVEKSDTLEMIPKVSYEKRMKERQKEFDKWQKEQEKRRKREQPYDSIMPIKPLTFKMSTNGNVDPTERIVLEMPEPLTRCDTSMIHLYMKMDSLWYKAPHRFRQRSVRVFEIEADWKLEGEYSLEIDSAAFIGIYGLASKPLKQGIQVRGEDDYSSFFIDVSGADSADSIVVQLLDKGDKAVRETLVGKDGTAEFFFLNPGTYYVRAFIDRNGNGKWDTGCYDQGLQAEPVYYFNEEIECKAKWDVSRKWNLNGVPRHRQKPLAITKQKPDKAKQLKNRNIERARQLGKEYIGKNGNTIVK